MRTNEINLRSLPWNAGYDLPRLRRCVVPLRGNEAHPFLREVGHWLSLPTRREKSPLKAKEGLAWGTQRMDIRDLRGWPTFASGWQMWE